MPEKLTKEEAKVLLNDYTGLCNHDPMSDDDSPNCECYCTPHEIKNCLNRQIQDIIDRIDTEQAVIDALGLVKDRVEEEKRMYSNNSGMSTGIGEALKIIDTQLAKLNNDTKEKK